MLKKLILILFLFCNHFLFSQKEGNIWYFGQNAGIDFNAESPTAITDGAMNTTEGCATMSDNMGNILFYTNGVTVWNSEHQVMPNGDELMGNVSSTQSSIIIKKPGLNNTYFLFTTGHQADIFGLRFTEVDMNLDDGLGDITAIKNIEVQSRILEKVVAVRKENMQDYWLVIHLWDSVRFHSYEITESGLDFDPVISDVGSHVFGSPNTTHGYMKATQTGDRLALAHGGFLHDVEVFDFNTETGEVSNPVYLRDFGEERPYGVEFSPDGSLLYCSIIGEDASVFQYHLEGDTSYVQNSKLLIGDGLDFGGALQLAPNGKIYHVGKYGGTLAVINDPNTIGEGCNYQLDGLYLDGKLGELGLPNFSNSIYQEPPVTTNNVCDGDTTSFIVNLPDIDSVMWDFGDIASGENNFSNEMSPQHYYNGSGNYVVTLTSFSNGEESQLQFPLRIYLNPSIDLGEDGGLCEGQTKVLNASTEHGYYKWQDGSIEPLYYASIIGTYWVDVRANSCFGSDTIILGYCNEKIIMPNVFTPNGDGKNDWFEPLFYKDVLDATISIYNRWGKIVYENTVLPTGWDGRTNDSKAAAGVYYYVINYRGFTGLEYQIKGIVTLLR